MSSPMEELFPKLAGIIRAASGLAAKDINFYKSIDGEISQQSNEHSNQLLEIINQVASASRSGDTINKDIISDNWNSVSELIDSFLERSDIAFDQLKKTPAKNDVSSAQLTYLDDGTSVNNPTSGSKIEKPQLSFKYKVDNSESHPFKPLLTSKPHSRSPFKEVFELQQGEDDISFYKQPYEQEILNQDYNQKILEKFEPIPFTDWEKTEAIWVADIPTLEKMLVELRKADVIAIDLEHHDYRSYYGIVCLMQISTRDQDWLIDTLALRDDLQVLNEVFTDPLVTKVLHGAFMDVIWLQRDLGLYLVSLFDTYHASKALGFPKHSLAYLLERFAGFKTSKKYQLADWRVRPLTKPMRLYARADTHFLLYIFDVLRNMLLEANKMTQVLYDSRNVALRRFEYSRFQPKMSRDSLVFTNFDKDESWRRLLYQYNIPTSKAQLVKGLYEWRDEMAKSNDESPRYIMPNQLLAALASIAPTSPEGILSISNTASTSVTEFVRKNLKDIADIIKEAMKLADDEDMRLLDNAMQKTNGGASMDVDSNDEKITLSKAKQCFDLFQKALNSEGAVNSTPEFNIDTSQLFAPEMLKPEEESTIQRQDLIESKLNLMSNPRTVDANVKKVDKDESPIDTEQPEEEGEHTESNMFKEVDDIIVLKKKTAGIKHKKGTQDLDEAADSKDKFDYTKAQSVIKPKERQKGKKRKTTEFNPYGKESEGPKPAKKQQILHQGKATSFVDKKRKK